eukprot:1652515-Lingulodinium_polyedra.AAC.1
MGLPGRMHPQLGWQWGCVAGKPGGQLETRGNPTLSARARSGNLARRPMRPGPPLAYTDTHIRA